MSELINDKIGLGEKLVDLSYLRSEYASQNTYFATMRLAFAIGLVSAYTKSLYILIFSIILLIGGYIQYKLMGEVLININKNHDNRNKKIFKMREINNYIFIFYSILFMICIFLQYKYDIRFNKK